MSATQRAINDAKKAGYTSNERSVFLDPLFWRALGRSRKWDQDERDVGARSEIWTSVWLRRWHEFVDELARGRSVEESFERLEKIART